MHSTVCSTVFNVFTRVDFLVAEGIKTPSSKVSMYLELAVVITAIDNGFTSWIYKL